MRFVGTLAVTAALIAGCSSSKGKATDQPAGRVLSVSGEVSATRGETTRELTVDANVFADDVIATGASAEVMIVLTHNGAHLSLAANASTRIDGSVAWRAPKTVNASILEVTPDDPTLIAGRGANREGADDPRTAIGNKDEIGNEHPEEQDPTPDQAETATPQSVSPGAIKDGVIKDGGDGLANVEIGSGGGGGSGHGYGAGAGAGNRANEKGTKNVKANPRDGKKIDAGKTDGDKKNDALKAGETTRGELDVAEGATKEAATFRISGLKVTPADAEARAIANRALRQLVTSIARCVERDTAVSVEIRLVFAPSGKGAVELVSRLPKKESSCISKKLTSLSLPALAGKTISATLHWAPR